jgi:hypothetical protein
VFRKNGVSNLILGIQPYDHMGAGPVRQDRRYFAPDSQRVPRSQGSMEPQVFTVVNLSGQYLAGKSINLDKFPQAFQNRPGDSHAEHGRGEKTIRTFIIEVARIRILNCRCIVGGMPPGYPGGKFLEGGTGYFGTYLHSPPPLNHCLEDTQAVMEMSYSRARINFPNTCMS